MGGKQFPPLFFAHFSDILSKTLCYVYMGCLKSLTLGREAQFWTLGFIYTIPPFHAFFLIKKWPMKSSDFISGDLSLLFLHAGLNWDLVFELKTKRGGGNVPSHFSRIFRIFFKNFELGSWGFGSRNSILYSIVYNTFLPVLIPLPPPISSIFYLQMTDEDF